MSTAQLCMMKPDGHSIGYRSSKLSLRFMCNKSTSNYRKRHDWTAKYVDYPVCDVLMKKTLKTDLLLSKLLSKLTIQHSWN